MIRLFFLIAFITSTASVYSQDTRISGVVTYFFNDNFGDKPDTGSKVYIIENTASAYLVKVKPAGDTVKLPSYFKATLDTFNMALTYRAIYANYKIIESKKRQIPADVIEKLNKYGGAPEERFKELDSRAANIGLVIENSKAGDIQSAVVDGNGSFSVRIKKPGTYYVYVKSNHRKGHTLSTILGKFDCQEVIIGENDEKSISVNFKP